MESINRRLRLFGSKIVFRISRAGCPTYASQAGRLTYARNVGLSGPTPEQVGGRLYAIIALCVLHSALIAAPFPYHLPPLSSASVGAGLATLAEGDDAATVFWNPAGIALMNQMSAQLTVTSFEGSKPASWSVLIANSAHGQASQFGLGFVRRRSSNAGGEFTSFEVLNPLAYRGLRSNIAWGFTPKFVAENYGDNWVYGMKIDLGVSMQTHRKSGMVLAFAMQNAIGSNLRAFQWDTWGGIKSGSEENRLRMYMQVRLDKPFKLDYISENYRIGARLMPSDPIGPEVRAGLIRERGIVQYTAGLGYPMGKKSSLIEYAIIMEPGDKNSFAHFLTYGYHVRAGTPSNPGRMSW